MSTNFHRKLEEKLTKKKYINEIERDESSEEDVPLNTHSLIQDMLQVKRDILKEVKPLVC